MTGGWDEMHLLSGQLLRATTRTATHNATRPSTHTGIETPHFVNEQRHTTLHNATHAATHTAARTATHTAKHTGVGVVMLVPIRESHSLNLGMTTEGVRHATRCLTRESE